MLDGAPDLLTKTWQSGRLIRIRVRKSSLTKDEKTNPCMECLKLARLQSTEPTLFTHRIRFSATTTPERIRHRRVSLVLVQKLRFRAACLTWLSVGVSLELFRKESAKPSKLRSTGLDIFRLPCPPVHSRNICSAYLLLVPSCPSASDMQAGKEQYRSHSRDRSLPTRNGFFSPPGNGVPT